MAAISVLVVLVIVFGALFGIYYAKDNSGTSNGNSTSTVTITEQGSTLLLPVFEAWAPNYTSAQIQSNGGGSGSGIQGAGVGTVMIGGSDAYLTAQENTQYPNLLNIPIMISYQYVLFNLPGISTLNLNGSVIAGIFMGTITTWNNQAIQNLNPGVTLPTNTIVPVHRSEGSGDTFMFTHFLSNSNATWAKQVGAGTSVNWPSVHGELSNTGNSGVLSDIHKTTYSVGYVAGTYEAQIKADGGLGHALLQDQMNQFVAPTVANVSNAASGFLNSIPANGTVGLQYAPGSNSYPIADMEYVMVNSNQTSQASVNAIQNFFSWALSPAGGSNGQTLASFNLVPLPSTVIQQVDYPLINKIKVG